MQVLVVDAANVVGSRPDGWWKDRPGAAARLHQQLVAAALPYDEVVLVLEGAAKRGVEPGVVGGVRTVHAPGEGDDAIVGETREGCLVVTADRHLRSRVEEAGAEVRGPRWLLEQL